MLVLLGPALKNPGGFPIIIDIVPPPGNFSSNHSFFQLKQRLTWVLQVSGRWHSWQSRSRGRGGGWWGQSCRWSCRRTTHTTGTLWGKWENTYCSNVLKILKWKWSKDKYQGVQALWRGGEQRWHKDALSADFLTWNTKAQIITSRFLSPARALYFQQQRNCSRFYSCQCQCHMSCFESLQHHQCVETFITEMWGRNGIHHATKDCNKQTMQ